MSSNQDNSTDALTKLEQLSCFSTVKNMIDSGESVPSIAKFIREDAKESLEISEKSLRNRIYRYIQKNSKDYLREQMPRPHLALYADQTERLELMNGLYLLLSIHMDRIIMEYTVEKKIGKTIASTTSAIKVATEIFKTISEVEDSKDRKTEPEEQSWDKFMASAKERYASEWGEPIANVVFNPQSRRRILNAMEKIKRGSSADFLEVMRKKRAMLGLPEEHT